MTGGRSERANTEAIHAAEGSSSAPTRARRTLRDAQSSLASGGHPEIRRQLEDASYTKCVVTGTRQLDNALYVARQQLTEAMQGGRPLRHEHMPGVPDADRMQSARTSF